MKHKLIFTTGGSKLGLQSEAVSDLNISFSLEKKMMECFEKDKTPDVHRGLRASLVAADNRHRYRICNG